MVENLEPIVPEGTPLPTPPVGVPPYPITPFAVWTWDSPVIPSFYWNVYSAEQRVKMICKEIGRIEAYLNYLVNTTNQNLIDLQGQITKLDTRLTALEKKLAEEVARLDALIAKLREDLTAETKAREDADAALDTRITTESNKLHGEISTETQNRIHADDQLHGEITAETQARQDADTDLEARVRTDLATETQAREAGDSALGDRITAESEKLHGEVSAEAQARIHADDGLHGEISTETQARQDADSSLEAKLTTAIAKRLLPTEVTAGNEIEITQPDPNSNRIVIASTVAHSISELSSEVSGVKAALDAEVSERRAEDSKLWNAVNERIERGKILAGSGIRVENDPDSTTVTISATGSADLSAIEAKAEAASTAAGEAKSTAEAASTKAQGAESKAEEALTAAQGSLKSVAHTASLAGDGTASTPLSLTPATSTTLGGVKIGSGLAVTSDGTLSATAQSGGSGIAEVTHDATLKGTGASGSPLGVNYGEGLAVSGGKLTAEVTQAELNTVDAKATQAVSTAQEAKTAAQGSLKKVAVGTGITGDGTTESPLAAKLGLGLESSSQGQIQLKTDSSFYTSSGKLEMAPATATVRGGVKVGAGLKVNSDGVLSTTASAGLTKVAHGATLTGDGTAGSPLEVKAATESEAGVLTEARVRELGASGITEVNHDSSLEGEGNQYSELSVAPGTKDRIGGVKEASDGLIKIWSDGTLIPRVVTEDTEKDDENGMVSKATITALAKATSFAPNRGIENYNGNGVAVKPDDWNLGFNANGELSLAVTNDTATGTKEWDVRESTIFTRDGSSNFVITVGSGPSHVNDDKHNSYWMVSAYFEIMKVGSSTWEAADTGTFEAFVDVRNLDNNGYIHSGYLCVRPTYYGINHYAPEKGAPEGTEWGIQKVRVYYAVQPFTPTGSNN